MDNKNEVSFTGPLNVEIKQPDKKTDDKPSVNPAVLDFIKWLIGTAALAWLGFYTNNKVKETEMILKRMEIDAKLIEAVSNKYDSNRTVQLSYLKYISPFITTDSLKEGVRKQILALGKEVDADATDRLQSNIASATAEVKSTISDELKNKLETVAETVPTNPQPMDSFKVKESRIVGARNVASIDSEAIKNIQQSKILATPTIEFDYILQAPPETKWLKRGYYVEFNNTLRIGANRIDTRMTTVTLKRLINGKAEDIGEKEVALVVGNPMQVDDGEYRYKISLDYIGAGGKNPFTRAAYITVATYRKAPIK